MGVGTQGSVGEAQEFRNKYGMDSVIMLWDPTFDSWNHYGIRGQPQAILLDPQGTPITQWSGAFSESEALDLAREYT